MEQLTIGGEPQFRRDGRPIYVVQGAADEVTDTTSSGGTSPTADSSEGSGATTPDATDKEDNPRVRELSRENAKYRTRAREAEADRERLASELKTIQDKDKSELERAQGRVQELESRIKAQDNQIRSQAVQIAFLTSVPDIAWHDPDDALILVEKELQDIEVDEDGVLDKRQVGRVVRELAKKKPHLVKARGKAETDGVPDADTGTTGNGRRSGGAGLDETALRQKYAALRR